MRERTGIRIKTDDYMERRERHIAKKRRRQEFEEIKILYPEYETYQ